MGHGKDLGFYSKGGESTGSLEQERRALPPIQGRPDCREGSVRSRGEGKGAGAEVSAAGQRAGAGFWA